MDPQRVDDDQEAITAVVGTVLVLAITVAGIAMALFLGVPTVERLQEASAAKAAIGQLAAVDGSLRALTIANSSRVTGISPLQGTMTLGPGSQWLVTWLPGACADFAVTGWATARETGTLTVTNCAGVPAGLCAGAAPYTNCVRTVGWDGSALAAGTQTMDYSITLYNGTGALQVQAWLLGSDRLSWQRGNSQAILEAGTVFANEQGSLYLVTGPRIDDSTSHVLLSMPRLTAATMGSLGGDGEHTIYTRLENRNLLVENMDATQIRIDIHGDWSEAWCNAFLTRETLATPSGTYAEVADHGCSDPAPTDGVRAVTYTLPASATFTLTQSVYAAELQV